MGASKVTIMAMAVLTLMISPAFAVSNNVEESGAAEPNVDTKRLKCQIRCSAECFIDPKPAACVLTCMTNCLGGKAINTIADFCTTGCMVTTCFNGKPGTGTKDTVKSCVKSCSDGCGKSSNKPCLA